MLVQLRSGGPKIIFNSLLYNLLIIILKFSIKNTKMRFHRFILYIFSQLIL